VKHDGRGDEEELIPRQRDERGADPAHAHSVKAHVMRARELDLDLVPIPLLHEDHAAGVEGPLRGAGHVRPLVVAGDARNRAGGRGQVDLALSFHTRELGHDEHPRLVALGGVERGRVGSLERFLQGDRLVVGTRSGPHHLPDDDGGELQAAQEHLGAIVQNGHLEIGPGDAARHLDPVGRQAAGVDADVHRSGQVIQQPAVGIPGGDGHGGHRVAVAGERVGARFHQESDFVAGRFLFVLGLRLLGLGRLGLLLVGRPGVVAGFAHTSRGREHGRHRVHEHTA